LFECAKVAVVLTKPLNTMIEAKDLRLGNLLIWDPQLTNPQITLQPMLVEIVSITKDKIGYTPYKLEQRVEPFEDDRMVEMETVLKAKEEFAPVELTTDIFEKSGFESTNGTYQLKGFGPQILKKGNIWFAALENSSMGIEIMYLHQLQNLYFIIVKEELQISL
jgi:hypothetical protein